MFSLIFLLGAFAGIYLLSIDRMPEHGSAPESLSEPTQKLKQIRASSIRRDLGASRLSFDADARILPSRQIISYSAAVDEVVSPQALREFISLDDPADAFSDQAALSMVKSSGSAADGGNDKDETEKASFDHGLDIPVALKWRAISSTTARLEWEAIDGADGYNVYLCEDRRSHWSDCSSMDVENNWATLGGLNPGSRYRIDVIAVGADGRLSESSGALYLETLGPDGLTVVIPAFDTATSLADNGVCYNDCANAFAIRVDQGRPFDLDACTQKCNL